MMISHMNLHARTCRHWRQVEVACMMMNTLLRKDMPVPTHIAQMAFKVRSFQQLVIYWTKYVIHLCR